MEGYVKRQSILHEPVKQLNKTYANVNVVREAASRLRVKEPVRISDSIRADLRVWPSILHPLLRSRNVDDTINHSMSYMNALRTKLLRQRVGKCSKCPLPSGEAGHLRIALHRSCGTCEDQSRCVLFVCGFEQVWQRCL